VSLFDSLVAAALPITPRFIVGRVARRYIAGESIADAVVSIRRLNARGAVCTVDVLGEFIEEFAEAQVTAKQYGDTLDAIEANGLDCNISVKLTALGLLLDEPGCTELVRELARQAMGHGSFVRVDMEDSPVTDRTLALVRTLRAEGLPVGAVLQAYLHRTREDAQRLADEGVPVRLCKGIYKEPEEIAFQGREEIRQSFRDCLDTLLAGRGQVGIATHDEVLVEYALGRVAALRPTGEDVEFQMLLGVREWLRDELLAKGQVVRIYVPFGDSWYGYAKRRLRENPEIAGHVARAMLGFK